MLKEEEETERKLPFVLQGHGPPSSIEKSNVSEASSGAPEVFEEGGMVEGSMHNPQFAIGVIRKQGMRLYLVIGKN
ncbi:hypothetical protein Vi05172_g6425 [Venturia inaequalis]|nr:hypothetical protein Vi05172_g6425 [Venturia inaequalis]